MDGTNESVGFVARGCLLAAAAGLVVLTTALAVSAGIDAVRADEPADGTFSDVVWLQETPVYMESRGVVAPSIAFGEEEAVLCFLPGGEPWVSRMADEGMLVQVGEVSDGLHRVGIAGLPHSRRTFAASELILSAPRNRRVVLISTEGFLPGLTTKADDLNVGDILDELYDTSMIVWIYGGEAEGFTRQRQTAREFVDGSILVYLDNKQPIRKGALRAYLRRSGLGGAGASVSLLTLDAPLAIMAAELGVESHLIRAGDLPEPQPPRFHHHRTLRKFKESLSEAPISD